MNPDVNAAARCILLVEDNEDDVFIFRRVYKHTQLAHPVHVVTDGQEALDYLHGRAQFADRARYAPPFLVLLDLKLPRRTGFDVLQAAHSGTGAADPAVVILTSSAEERDIRRARELGAFAFLVKPPTATTLTETVAAALWRLAPGSGAEPKIHGNLLTSRVTPLR